MRILPAQGNRPRSRLVDRGDDVKQRCFTATRRSHNTDELPFSDREAYPIQGFGGDFPFIDLR
ncbi:hypothetical protein D3C81_1563790 [compost metagenome]